MKSPERIPLSRRTADILEEVILEGRWLDRLPGYRTLSIEMGVSRRTMETALKILTRRNVILPAEGKMARQVHPDILSKRSRCVGRNFLLIVSATPFQRQDLVSRSILEQTISLFTRKGWTVNFESTEECSSSAPGEEMQSLLSGRENERWLLVRPSYAAIKWCLDHHLRVVCLGGELEDLNAPTVSASTTRLLEDAVSRLANLGHKRICMLVNHSSIQARQNVVQRMNKVMKKECGAFHPTYNVPSIQSNDAASLWGCLEELFSYTPPTALVATEAQQLITIYAYCLQNGLKIPQDLSVIVTLESDQLDWFYPHLTHYKFPVQKFVEKVSKWIEHYPVGHTEHLLLDPVFIEGESIAAPR